MTSSPIDTMQAIAKEMNFSETTFVLPAETLETDVRVRVGGESVLAGEGTLYV